MFRLTVAAHTRGKAKFSRHIGKFTQGASFCPVHQPCADSHALVSGIDPSPHPRVDERLGSGPHFDVANHFSVRGEDQANILGGINPGGPDRVLQEFTANPQGLIYSSPVYFDGKIYIQGVGDVILLLYLLLLSGVCTLLAGAAAGSTYSWVGVSREMMTMMTLEPVLAVALCVGAVHARSFRLADVLAGSPYSAAVPVSGVLMLLVMLAAFQAFAGRAPFDVAEAETEIMDGPLTEYSGRKLAMFRLAQMVKLVVYSGLFVGLFVPWGSGLPFPLALLVFWAKALALAIGVALVAATHARYRVDQAIRRYAALLAVSVGAIVLAALGR